MFVIKNTVTGRIHREPNKKPWASTEYKSQAAAKAGITRTLKYYQKALDNVAECKSRGESPIWLPYTMHIATSLSLLWADSM